VIKIRIELEFGAHISIEKIRFDPVCHSLLLFYKYSRMC